MTVKTTSKEEWHCCNLKERFENTDIFSVCFPVYSDLCAQCFKLLTDFQYYKCFYIRLVETQISRSFTLGTMDYFCSFKQPLISFHVDTHNLLYASKARRLCSLSTLHLSYEQTARAAHTHTNGS